jgi:hypothetical protein
MKLDEFHYHEVLDRLTVIQTMISELLLDHPVMAEYGDLEDKVLSADAFLADAHQKCAQLRAEAFPEGDGL